MRRPVVAAAMAFGTCLSITAVALPAAAAHPVTVTGRVHIVESIGGSLGHRPFQTLKAGRHSWLLHLPGAQTLPSGTEVTVQGVVDRGTLDATSVRVIGARPAVKTTGTQSVYVIRVQWTGNTAADVGTSAISTALTRIGSWFAEVSYGKLPGFTVTQDPTYHMISAPADCSPANGANDIFTEALAAAGITDTESDYQHVIVYFPSGGSGCGFAGLAEVGGDRVWLNGDLTDRVITHELGHNISLSHSHSLTCTSGGVQVTISTTCMSPDEYGDPADTMGSEGADIAGHYNAAQKAKLGWLGSTLDTTSPCGSAVTLNPYEAAPASGFVAARVDAGADPTTGAPISYWFEYRHPDSGSVDTTDGPLPAGTTDGVLMHMTDPIVSGPGSPNVGPDILDAKTGDNSDDFTDAAIPASGSVTTPQGYTFTVGPTLGATASLSMSTTHPSVPVGMSATQSGTGAALAWSPPGCLGGAATSIAHYAVTVDGGAPQVVAGTSAGISGLDSGTEHTFTVAATNNDAATGAAGVVPMSAPKITGYDVNLLRAFRVFFNSSVSNGGLAIVGYEAHAVKVGGGPEFTNFYPNDTSTSKQIDITDFENDTWADGQTYHVWLTPEMFDGSEGPASQVLTLTVGDTIPPTVHLAAPTQTTTLASKTTVRWSATDRSPASGVKNYDVRYVSASVGTGLGSYVKPAALQGTKATSASFALAAGSTYCFSVRAHDNNGNVSGWTGKRCTSRPLDDRALSADAHWRRGTGSSYFLGTVTSATATGATLSRTGVSGRHLVLVATTCSTCGKVSVYVGSKRITTVSLHSATTKNRVLFALPAATMSHATVKLKVASSSGSVKIDGLVVRAV